MSISNNLLSAILDAADWLAQAGVTLPADLAAEMAALKARSLRRDRREPAREEKEKLEKKITALVLRRFRKQCDGAIARLETQHPERKAADLDILINADDWTDDDEEEFDAELIDLLTQARLGGIALFGKKVPIQIDYTLTNTEAAAAARAYAYELVKGIDDTSRDALRQAISAFVETPGMTMGDIVKQLGNIYDPDRAMLIAVTEVSRNYAAGQQAAGEAVAAEFPGVRVVKHWYTNNDTYYEGNVRRGVCEICEELDGMEVEIDEKYHSDLAGEDYAGPGEPHPGCRCWEDSFTRIEQS